MWPFLPDFFPLVLLFVFLHIHTMDIRIHNSSNNNLINTDDMQYIDKKNNNRGKNIDFDLERWRLVREKCVCGLGVKGMGIQLRHWKIIPLNVFCCSATICGHQVCHQKILVNSDKTLSYCAQHSVWLSHQCVLLLDEMRWESQPEPKRTISPTESMCKWVIVMSITLRANNVKVEVFDKAPDWKRFVVMMSSVLTNVS